MPLARVTRTREEAKFGHADDGTLFASHSSMTNALPQVGTAMLLTLLAVFLAAGVSVPGF